MSLGLAKTYAARATTTAKSEEAIKLLAMAIEELVKEIRRLQG